MVDGTTTPGLGVSGMLVSCSGILPGSGMGVIAVDEGTPDVVADGTGTIGALEVDSGTIGGGVLGTLVIGPGVGQVIGRVVGFGVCTGIDVIKPNKGAGVSGAGVSLGGTPTKDGLTAGIIEGTSDSIQSSSSPSSSHSLLALIELLRELVFFDLLLVVVDLLLQDFGDLDLLLVSLLLLLVPVPDSSLAAI